MSVLFKTQFLPQQVCLASVLVYLRDRLLYLISKMPTCSQKERKGRLELRSVVLWSSIML